jgi:nucleoid-associated protein YgaU
VALDKQRRLCLVADHQTCSTYGAAIAARPPFALAASPRRRVVARTTPIVLDQTRFDLRLPALRSDRVSGPGLLVGLLALAFVAIVVARPAGDGGAASIPPQPTTAAVASAAAHPSPVASSGPVVTARPAGSAQPATSAEPTASPPSAEPSASGATYKVKRGDTLSAIAARYGTTVKVLANLNHISDPSVIHAGQVLQLP